MRRTCLAATIVSLLAAFSTAVHADDLDRRADPGKGRAPREITVKIIGFNDYHGNLQSPGTFGLNTTIPADSAARRSAAPSTWPRTSRS